MTQIAAGETQLALELEAFALKKKKGYSQESTGWWSTWVLSNQQKKKVPNSLFFLVFAKPDMYPLPLFLPAPLFHREKKYRQKGGKRNGWYLYSYLQEAHTAL